MPSGQETDWDNSKVSILGNWSAKSAATNASYHTSHTT